MLLLTKHTICTATDNFAAKKNQAAWLKVPCLSISKQVFGPTALAVDFTSNKMLEMDGTVLLPIDFIAWTDVGGFVVKIVSLQISRHGLKTFL